MNNTSNHDSRRIAELAEAGTTGALPGLGLGAGKCGAQGDDDGMAVVCTQPAGHPGGHCDYEAGFAWTADEPAR